MPSGSSGEPALLAEVRRGGIVEGVIRGHLVLVDEAGVISRQLGNPGTVSTLRSASKPFQTASFVASGAVDSFRLGSESVAIACASHQGEPGHVAEVDRILTAAGLDESALRCGTHLPSNADAAAELLGRGGRPTQLHNNCSGKHAAMLATCVHRDWPRDSYLERNHPLQVEIAERLGGYAQLDPKEMPYGIDGCGLPSFGLSLQDFARALVRGTRSDPAIQRCQAAMAKHPWLVGGTTSFDTALIGAAGNRLVSKGGAAAIFGAVARDGSWSLVIKLEAGGAVGLAQIALRALQQIGALAGSLPTSLAKLSDEPMTNWVGTAVGEIRPVFQL
ncbi:MAG: asparaginase [Candidatus Dormiibacterota bacterium]